LILDYQIYRRDFTLITLLQIQHSLSPDNEGALKLPSYGLVDLGATFSLQEQDGALRANINNLLDTTYIAESN
jgi:outer membrane receptor protein involved in Fe transport